MYRTPLGLIVCLLCGFRLETWRQAELAPHGGRISPGSPGVRPPSWPLSIRASAGRKELDRGAFPVFGDLYRQDLLHFGHERIPRS
jgi:hypothetical protein